MDRVVEICSYNLKPGTGRRFHELFVREALPVLQRLKVDVVACGPSLHDDDSYFLMRAHSRIGPRKTEDAFGSSNEWRHGLREVILAYVESYTTTTICVNEATLRGLRRASRQVPDEERLKKLNDEHVEALMGGDVRWYEEHLADGFVCIESDGSLLDKTEFLRITGRGPDFLQYRSDRVRVRIYGDTALVQATGLFRRKDGSAGKRHHIDVYARNGCEWKMVSAQTTSTWSLGR